MAEHSFVAGVATALTRLDDRTAQDEADFVLLGGTVERTAKADPDCWYCHGSGLVCPCHGLGVDACRAGPCERCECVSEVVSASTLNGSSMEKS